MKGACTVWREAFGKGQTCTSPGACLPYLWRTIKYEEVYVHEYASPKEARQQLREYVQFYNHQRLHQALEYQTPATVYFGAGAKESVRS